MEVSLFRSPSSLFRCPFRPPYRSPFRPPSPLPSPFPPSFPPTRGGRTEDASLFLHGEARGCFAFCSMGETKGCFAFYSKQDPRLLEEVGDLSVYLTYLKRAVFHGEGTECFAFCSMRKSRGCERIFVSGGTINFSKSPLKRGI